jgi:hypothetical protein
MDQHQFVKILDGVFLNKTLEFFSHFIGHAQTQTQYLKPNSLHQGH